MQIKMHPVVSSNIDAAGYDEKTQTLAIRFKTGKTYHYEKVPKNMYNGIFTARSSGKFFRDNIIGVKYKFSKVQK